MKRKLENNLFKKIHQMSETIVDLQKQIIELNYKAEVYNDVQKCHLLRIKNGDSLTDDYIINTRLYNDMSPEVAYEYYNQKDTNYILLDVSSEDFSPKKNIPEATKIPYDELTLRYGEILNKSIPILVISEDGVKSILACNFLNEMGFYNINNISGGYKYWPWSINKVKLQSVA